MYRTFPYTYNNEGDVSCWLRKAVSRSHNKNENAVRSSVTEAVWRDTLGCSVRVLNTRQLLLAEMLRERTSLGAERVAKGEVDAPVTLAI